ncbi:MAG: DUF4245 family protein, partial [Catenulispora sp.]|nr:DUF4245 family protein [Catenulispora sp.]
DKQYVALDQVSGGRGVASVLAAQAPDAAPVSGTAGTVPAGGFEWQVYATADGKRHALVRTMAPTGSAAATTAGPVGVVVSGTVGVAELTSFAGELK